MSVIIVVGFVRLRENMSQTRDNIIMKKNLPIRDRLDFAFDSRKASLWCFLFQTEF